MKKIFQKHKSFWSKKELLLNIFVSLIFLFASLCVTYYANSYTFIHASNPVTDLILDNVPIMNVDFIYSEGAMIFLMIIFLMMIYEPKTASFILRSVALFFLIRSGFVILTHIALPPHHSYLDAEDFIHKISSGDDLFFSAHTGLPFLMALIFWRKKYIKYLFLIFSAIGASAVLVGHIHYSIDVFSAFFITYGIFEIAKNIFKPDYKLSEHALSHELDYS